MNQSLPQIEDNTAGKPGPEWSSLVIGLVPLVFALLLGRGYVSGVLTGKNQAPPPDRLDHASALGRAVPASPDTGRILRPGKRLRVFYVAFGWDDPNDDETSDDPTDDDDGWEGLSAVSETEAPVFAWFPQVGCYQSDLETQSEPLWSEPFVFTSFLKLQRLRC